MAGAEGERVGRGEGRSVTRRTMPLMRMPHEVDLDERSELETLLSELAAELACRP